LSRRTQGACAVSRLLNRTFVVPLVLLDLVAGDEVEHGCDALSHSGLLVDHVVVLEVLSESVTLQALHHDSIAREVIHFLPVRSGLSAEVEVQLVDLVVALAAVVLEHSCQETLGELLTRDPVGHGAFTRQPVAQLLAAFLQVLEPGPQRLETEETNFLPVGRHLVEEEAVVHAIKLTRHQGDALDGVLQVAHSFTHFVNQFGEFLHLVLEEGRLDANVAVVASTGHSLAGCRAE